MIGGVVDEMPEVAADGWFASADVDVEDLHPLKFVDYGFGFFGGEFARVAPARRTEAVNALQVAGICQLPGQADGGVKSRLHLVGEAAAFNR